MQTIAVISAALSTVLAVTIGPVRTDDSKPYELIVKDKAIYGTRVGPDQFRNCNGQVFKTPIGAQLKATRVTCGDGEDFKPYSGHGKFSPKAKHSPRPTST